MMDESMPICGRCMMSLSDCRHRTEEGTNDCPRVQNAYGKRMERMEERIDKLTARVEALERIWGSGDK